MHIDRSTGQTPTTTFPMSADFSASEMNNCRQRFIDAVDYITRYIESCGGVVVSVPIGVLDYNGDPDAKVDEMRALWTTLVCMFGAPVNGKACYGYLNNVPAAHQYLRELKEVINTSVFKEGSINGQK